MHGSTTDKYGGRNGIGHAGVIELGKAKGGFAELAVFLLGVRQPLHQAFLVDVFDAAATLARIEERFFQGTLAATYTASVCLFLIMIVRVGRVGDGIGRLARAIVGVVSQP